MKPYLGMMVVVRDRCANGSDVHPAVVQRVWSPQELGGQGTMVCVNLTVFPDTEAPYSLTSVFIYASDVGTGRSCWPAG